RDTTGRLCPGNHLIEHRPFTAHVCAATVTQVPLEGFILTVHGTALHQVACEMHTPYRTALGDSQSPFQRTVNTAALQPLGHACCPPGAQCLLGSHVLVQRRVCRV